MIFYRDWHRPAVITVDLDDTLYDNTDIIKYAEYYIREKIGNDYLNGILLSEKLYKTLKSQIAGKCPQLINDVSLLRFFTYKEFLMQKGMMSSEAANIAVDLVNEVRRVRSRINVSRETLDVLQRIKGHYPLIGLSNGNANFDLAGYTGYFTDILYPNVNVTAKPHYSLFYQAAWLAGCEISGVCHIGDDAVTDIYGSISAGAMSVMQTQFRNDSRRLSVLPNVVINDISELIQLLEC